MERMNSIKLSNNIKLVDKKFNFPGMEAHYYFNITLDEGIKLNKERIYI